MSSCQKTSGWHPQGTQAPADNGAELSAAREFPAVHSRAGSIGRDPSYTEAFSSAPGVFLPAVHTNTRSLVVPGVCFRSQNKNTNYHTCIAAAHTGRAMCHWVSPSVTSQPKLLLMGTHVQEPSASSIHLWCNTRPGAQSGSEKTCLNWKYASPKGFVRLGLQLRGWMLFYKYCTGRNPSITLITLIEKGEQNYSTFLSGIQQNNYIFRSDVEQK